MRKSVALGAAVIGLAGCASGNPPRSSPAVTVTVRVPGPAVTVTVTAPAPKPAHAPRAAPQPAPQPAGPVVIARFNGSGTQKTAPFATADRWHLSWKFDCSNFGQSGNFQVSTYTTDGSQDPNGVDVNELSMGRGPVATFAYGDAGQHYLSVNSECSWALAVVTG